MRLRTPFGIAGLLLLGAMIGPPLAGAASTMFWSKAADGNTAISVAARMYDRIYALPAGLIFIAEEQRLPDVSLSIPCAQPYLERLATGDWGTVLLEEAVRQHSMRRLDGLLNREPAWAALMSLPHPALGALDACIGGSLFVDKFCEAYARRITEQARERAVSQKVNIVRLVQRETEPIWCAAKQENAGKR